MKPVEIRIEPVHSLGDGSILFEARRRLRFGGLVGPTGSGLTMSGALEGLLQADPSLVGRNVTVTLRTED